MIPPVVQPGDVFQRVRMPNDAGVANEVIKVASVSGGLVQLEWADASDMRTLMQAVSYASQTLNSGQQAQSRTNIAAQLASTNLDRLDGTAEEQREAIAAALTQDTTTLFSCRFGPGSPLASLTTGLYCTAYGHASQNKNQTADSCASYGAFSLVELTGGVGANSAFGTGAAQNCTTAFDISAFGASALVNNTTGHANSGFGSHVLRSCTTGTRNNGFGERALELLTTGYQNSAFGEKALPKITTSYYCSAFGPAAFFSLTSGTNNNGFGVASFFNLTSGSNNNGFGVSCFEGLTTGSNNIGIGDYAASTVTSGSNQICIGSGITWSSTTGSNRLNIGNLIYATTMDGTGSTISTGNVGIGVESPQDRLHIKGEVGSGFRVESTGAYSIINLKNTGGETLLVPSAQTFSIYTGAVGSSVNRFTVTSASGGRIGVLTDSPISTLDVRGNSVWIPLAAGTQSLTVNDQLCLEWVSASSVRFLGRGSDGTTRSSSAITLS